MMWISNFGILFGYIWSSDFSFKETVELSVNRGNLLSNKVRVKFPL